MLETKEQKQVQGREQAMKGVESKVQAFTPMKLQSHNGGSIHWRATESSFSSPRPPPPPPSSTRHPLDVGPSGCLVMFYESTLWPNNRLLATSTAASQ